MCWRAAKHKRPPPNWQNLKLPLKEKKKNACHHKYFAVNQHNFTTLTHTFSLKSLFGFYFLQFFCHFFIFLSFFVPAKTELLKI